MAQPQPDPNAPQGGILGAFNRLVGVGQAPRNQARNLFHPRQLLQNPPQEGEVDADPHDPAAIIVRLQGERQLNEVREYNERKALDYLYIKTYGRKIDSKYLTYCAAMLTDYFDASHIYDQNERRRLLDIVIPAHMDERQRPNFRYTEDTVKRVRAVNLNNQGIVQKRHWLLPWVIQQETIEDLNYNGLLPVQPSYRWYHFLIPATAAAAVISGVSYLIYRALRDPTPTTTTPSLVKPLTQAILTATNPVSSPSMIQPSLEPSTVILKSLGAIHENLQSLSTAIQSIQPPSNGITLKHWVISKLMER